MTSQTWLAISGVATEMIIRNTKELSKFTCIIVFWEFIIASENNSNYIVRIKKEPGL
jgi:hypothetical protein